MCLLPSKCLSSRMRNMICAHTEYVGFLWLVTNYHTEWFTTPPIYYFTISVSQKSGHDLDFSAQSHKMLAGLILIWGLDWGKIHFQFPYTAGRINCFATVEFMTACCLKTSHGERKCLLLQVLNFRYGLYPLLKDSPD